MAERGFSVRRMPGFVPAAVFVFVFLYAPIVLLTFYSFNAGSSLAMWEGFSFRWYVAAWIDVEAQGAAIRRWSRRVTTAHRTFRQSRSPIIGVTYTWVRKEPSGPNAEAPLASAYSSPAIHAAPPPAWPGAPPQGLGAWPSGATAQNAT